MQSYLQSGQDSIKYVSEQVWLYSNKILFAITDYRLVWVLIARTYKNKIQMCVECVCVNSGWLA